MASGSQTDLLDFKINIQSENIFYQDTDAIVNILCAQISVRGFGMRLAFFFLINITVLSPILWNASWFPTIKYYLVKLFSLGSYYIN